MSKAIQDERIIQEARKQNSIGFTLLYFGVLMDILYRTFILHEPLLKSWDLALLFLVVTFYMAGKRLISGLAYELNHQITIRKIVFQSFIGAIVFACINYLLLSKKSIFELIILGIIYFSIFFGIVLLIQYISKKKNENMLKDEKDEGQ